MIDNVSYDRIDNKGLHYTQDEKEYTLGVDHVIICAGQLSDNSLEELCKKHEVTYDKIGGAFEARELDAKFAIDQGARLAQRV